MSLYLLSEISARRGLTHEQSKSDPNLARIWEIIDGRSVPVLQVNLVNGTFLEMDHYPLLDAKVKIKLADTEAEYRRRFKGRRKKADAATSACKEKTLQGKHITER